MCAVAHEQADDNADAVLLDSYVDHSILRSGSLAGWQPGRKSLNCASFLIGIGKKDNCLIKRLNS